MEDDYYHPFIYNQGPIECSAARQKAYYADYFTCFLFQMPYKLNSIGFGYITSALLILIILISLFGRIKLNYRWFVLNLALIDLLTSFDYVCGYEDFKYTNMYRCVYYPGLLWQFFTFNHYMLKIPYFGIFFLTGSRFLSIYFSNIYKKFAKTWKIILVILVIEISYTLLNGSATLFNLLMTEASMKCYEHEGKTFQERYEITHSYPLTKEARLMLKEEEKCRSRERDKYDLRYDLEKADFYVLGIVLSLSIIFVVLLIIKLCKQIRFQATTNKEMLKTNVRIVIIFTIQTLFLTFLFIFDVIILYNNGSIYNKIHGNDFPKWLEMLFDEDIVIRSIREIRVFVDSVTILGFMSGYREDVKDSVIWIFLAPKRIWKKLMEKIYFKKKKNSIISIPYFLT